MKQLLLYDRLLRMSIAGLGLSCLLIGIGCVIFPLAPLSSKLAWLSSFTADGNIDIPARGFWVLDSRLWIALSSVLCATGGVAVWRRRQLALYTRRLTGHVVQYAIACVRCVVYWFKTETPSHSGALLFLCLAGAALRVWTMRYSMQYDESSTFTDFVQMPWIVGLTKYTAPNNHLFHTFLAHWTTSLFGETTYAVRLPALIGGLSLLPLTYICGRKLTDKNTALLATAWVATNHYMVSFSSNARGYTLGAMFFLMVVYLSTQLIQNGRLTRYQYLGLFLFTVCGLYAVPTMVYGVAGCYVGGLVFLILKGGNTNKGEIMRVFVTGLAALAASLALYAVVFLHLNYQEWREIPIWAAKLAPTSWDIFFNANWHNLLKVFDIFVWVFPSGAQAFLFICFVIGIVLVCRQQHAFRLLLIGCIVAAIALLLVQRVIPFARTWMFLIPWMALLISFPITQALSRILSSRGLTRVTAGLSVFLMVGTVPASLDRSFAVRDFPDAAAVGEYLSEHYKKGDHFVVPGYDIVPLNFYLYTRDIFHVRRHEKYPISALLDHFNGQETHRDWYLFQTASGRYVHVYPKDAEDIHEAARVFFVLGEHQEVPVEYKPWLDGFSRPRVIKRLKYGKTIWFAEQAY